MNAITAIVPVIPESMAAVSERLFNSSVIFWFPKKPLIIPKILKTTIPHNNLTSGTEKEKITAKVENGVLKIALPKVSHVEKKPQPKEIAIG